MSLVQGLLFVTQQFNGLANTARLVNAALFADRQVHRQVQKRIVAIWVYHKHVGQSGIDIGQLGVVFRMLIDPLAGQNFNGFQFGPRPRFGISSTKKSPHIGLRRLYQHAPIVA
jgi:hypothetical protein